MHGTTLLVISSLTCFCAAACPRSDGKGFAIAVTIDADYLPNMAGVEQSDLGKLV